MLPRHVIGFAFGAVFAVLASGFTTPASADRGDPDPAAEAYLSNLADETLGMFSDPNVSKADRRGRFRELLVGNVDFVRFGCGALGNFCPTVRANNRPAFDEYVTVLKDYADFLLFSQFENYENHTLEVISSSLRPRTRTTYVLVKGELKDENGRNVGGTDWVLIKSGAETAPVYKIFDIIIKAQDESGSFSLLRTQRDEFTSIMTQNNRDIGALIAFLKNRVDELKAEQVAAAQAATLAGTAMEQALPYPFFLPPFQGEIPFQETRPTIPQ